MHLNNAASCSKENIMNNKSSYKTAFIFDDEYIRHSLGDGHPESPLRLKAILKQMEDVGLDKEVMQSKPDADPLPFIKRVHSEQHIQIVENQAFDPSICRLAVSGVLKAVDLVCQKKVQNAFCAVRPPGHHATNNGEYGFCFFGNIAIAAKYAQKKYNLEKILIVDWDYHHGNGTEWAFYDDPSVLYFSTHNLIAFPMTGFPNCIGAGNGVGYNINVPLPSGTDDKMILTAFEKILLPKAEKFKPEMILISAGFDSREEDLLGDFNITDNGFAELTSMMMSIAATYSDSRLVSMLEGGYNPRGLALAVEAHLKTLISR